MDYQWKYHVIKRALRIGHEQTDTIQFSIYEVYRDEKENIVAIAAKKSDPGGDTAEALKADIGAMLEAFTLPILDYGQITEEIAKNKSKAQPCTECGGIDPTFHHTDADGEWQPCGTCGGDKKAKP